jgi:hypothetical protein
MSRNRGVRKPKLRDLGTAALSSEEKDALNNALAAQKEPVATAIIGAVAIEYDLESCLRSRIKPKSDEIWLSIVTDRGPLSSLSAKIQMAYAMRIIDESMRNDLDIVRVVRNAFAHSRVLLKFHHELVVAELLQAKRLPRSFKKQLQNPKVTESLAQSCYIILCLRLRIKLIKKTIKRRRAKIFGKQDLWEALVGYKNKLKARDTIAGSGLIARDVQSANPTLATLPPLGGGLLGPAFDRSNSSDK